MYTRLTGRASHGLVRRCTQSASSAFADGEQHHLPVDARGLAASIDLRHPTHAQQRVRPGTQHQLLQTTDLFQVPYLRGREDPLPLPLPLPPYVVRRP